MPGKLKGAMMAHTPTGWRSMISSMPGAMFSEITPCIKVGMPQATSTFSMERRISPRDSSSVLPHSMVIRRDKLFSVLFEQALHAVQVLGAVCGRGLPPAGEGSLGSLHGLVDGIGLRERHAPQTVPGWQG